MVMPLSPPNRFATSTHLDVEVGEHNLILKCGITITYDKPQKNGPRVLFHEIFEGGQMHLGVLR